MSAEIASLTSVIFANKSFTSASSFDFIFLGLYMTRALKSKLKNNPTILVPNATLRPDNSSGILSSTLFTLKSTKAKNIPKKVPKIPIETKREGVNLAYLWALSASDEK